MSRSQLFLRIVASAAFFLPAAGSVPALAAPRAVVVARTFPFRLVRHPTRTVLLPPALLRGDFKRLRGNVTTLPAVLQQPVAATFDAADGDMYVIDQQNVLRVEPDGGTTLFASLPTNSANGLTYDVASKTFYVTSSYSPSGFYPSVLAITAAGQVSVLAGGSTNGQTDGTGPQASFADPTGIAVDTHDGALYLADSDRVRRVTVGGVVTTVTQAGVLGFSGFGNRIGMAYDVKTGALYAADPQVDAILSISTANGAVATLAGQCLFMGQPSQFNCDPLQRDGVAKDALFASPRDIASDPSTGDLYVADTGNFGVRRLSVRGTTLTLAGNGIAGSINGAGRNAEFAGPVALAFDTKTTKLAVVDVSQTKASLRVVTTAGAAPPPPTSPIVLFDTMSPDATPFAIDWRVTKPASPQLTFSESIGRAGAISTRGRSTDVGDPFAGSLADCVLGADGSAWFVDSGNGGTTLDHFSNGTFAQVAIPNVSSFMLGPDSLALAADGNVWFALPSSNFGSIVLGFVTPGGTVTEYPPISDNGNGTSPKPAFAADGTVWISAGGTLVHADTSGHVLTEINYQTGAVTKGPDGNVWFTQADAVGTITPKNVLVVYPITAPNPNCNGCSRGIGAIAAGPDGALWFTETGAIGRLTVDGIFSEAQVLAARSNPRDITAGPDANMWFTDPGAQKIGRYALR